jgi:hypothetical protein
MAEGSTSTIEIDLRGGVYSNETGYAIGARLRPSSNLAWQPKFSAGAAQGLANYCMAPPPRLTFPATIALSSNPVQICGWGVGHNATNQTYALGFDNSSPALFKAWKVFGTGAGSVVGTADAVTASQSSANARTHLSCAAYWEQTGDITIPATGVGETTTPTHVTGGALFFSHPTINKIFYLLDSSGTTRSYTDDVSNVPAGAQALLVHLDRLWMAKDIEAAVSQVWYTDPFDAETVRPTNFLYIPDSVTALGLNTPGGLDASAQPHLVIGGRHTIYVLDGDPSQGNALERAIVFNVGVQSPMAMCTTPYGMVLLATDGQIYLIPPGAQQLVPVGNPIMDQLANFAPKSDSTLLVPTSLMWMPPYVYLYSQNDWNVGWMLELTDPQQPKWWGPIPHESGSVNAVFMADDGRGPVAAAVGTQTLGIMRGISRAATTAPNTFSLSALVWGAAPQITAVPQTVKTGYLYANGHDIELRRVTLITNQQTAANLINYTVVAKTVDGQSYTGVKQPVPLTALPSTVSPSVDLLNRHTYIFPGMTGVVSDAVWLEITGTADVATGTTYPPLDLQKLLVTYRTQPKVN